MTDAGPGPGPTSAAPTSGPRLIAAESIRGKTLRMRNVNRDDAAFIVAVRTDAAKSRHLSAVSADVEAQRQWIDDYHRRQDEAYFVIESSTGEPLGTVRLYDPQGPSFCWGSWVLVDAAPAAAAIESALMVYAYALDHLGFERAHFQVRRGNERVRAFHERFGARKVAENEIEYHYELSGADIRASMQRYQRHLPQGIEVKT